MANYDETKDFATATKPSVTAKAADMGTKGLATVIASSSVGTLIEWYDFYIFGSLARRFLFSFFLLTILRQLSFLLWLPSLRALLSVRSVLYFSDAWAI